MNSVQLHLALTHVPVILSLAGLAMLVVALFLKNATLTKTAYIVILIAGVAAIPVFFSGEGTEEAVEHLPGVSENIIEKHEEAAKLAMISIAAAGLVALSALFLLRFPVANRVIRLMVLLLVITSGALMAQTAHLGGQIRHTEIRNSVTQNETGGEQGDNSSNPSEKDDD